MTFTTTEYFQGALHYRTDSRGVVVSVIDPLAPPARLSLTKRRF
jgi:hypothetical protein